MFCPNCGTKNDDTATPCKKCGFKLSGASAPKFRGTMMLNSDQSVQDMVEEHRKKLAEAGQAPDATGAGGPTPPLPSVGSTPPKAVLQPPRASLPKRRMGTMLGVAPQVGGVQPPDFGRTPTPPVPEPASPPPPPATATPSPPPTVDAPAPGAVQPTPPRSIADPLAGTVAFGAVAPMPQVAPRETPDGLAAGRTEAFVAVPAAPALTAGRTEAFAAVPPAPASALAAGRTEAFEAVPPAPASALAAGRTEAFEAPPSLEPAGAPSVEPTPAAAALVHGRTEAIETPPASASVNALESAPSVPPVRPRRQVRPLEVFLIIATCGVYGLVLWARQRKPAGDQ